LKPNPPEQSAVQHNPKLQIRLQPSLIFNFKENFMETSTNSDGFNIEIMKHGTVEPVRRFRLPTNIVSLDDIERVTALTPVPYAGDERPIPYIRQRVSEFMLNKPA
jgi:hypothetical protein